MGSVEINKLRRKAKRLGLAVIKSSAKMWKTNNQMGFMILDTDNNSVLAGQNYELTLEAAEMFLDDYEAKLKGEMKKMIIFNHERLEAKINEMFEDPKVFAIKVEMSEDTINSRLSGETQFSQSEMNRFIEVLDIKPEEIHSMFFEVK